jgi:energy-converting hydrogenase Eha subunit C
MLAAVVGLACTCSRVPLLAVLSSGLVCAGCAISSTVATVAIATEAKRATLTGMLLLGFMMHPAEWKSEYSLPQFVCGSFERNK